MPAPDFKTLLVELRTAAFLTQTEMARLLHMDDGRGVSVIEKGVRPIHAETAQRLAELCGASDVFELIQTDAKTLLRQFRAKLPLELVDRTHPPAKEKKGDIDPASRLLRKIRLEAHGTMEEIAAALGVSHPIICNIENGRRPFFPNLRDRFAELAGIADFNMLLQNPEDAVVKKAAETLKGKLKPVRRCKHVDNPELKVEIQKLRSDIKVEIMGLDMKGLERLLEFARNLKYNREDEINAVVESESESTIKNDDINCEEVGQ